MRYEFRPVGHCNMCGSDRFELVGMRLNASQGLRPRRAEGIAVSVKKCLNCSLIFSDPQPIPENLSDHYGLPPEDYWSDLDWTPGYFADEIRTAKQLLSFQQGMTALDIGVGLGKAMLSLSMAGFDVWGIEPSEPFYQRAIERFDPPRIQMTSIEEAEFPDATFDFITFGAVLEHLYNPSEALKRALNWLMPGGIIQAEVPSSSHLMSKLINMFFRLRGTNYVTNLSPMHPPFHLYEFGLESFEKNGLENGYSIALHNYTVCSIYYLPKILHPPLRWWMDRTDTGMQLTVYLRKN